MDQQTLRLFREKIRCLERALGSNNKNETQCCGIGLTQCHALLEIAHKGEVSLVDLAAALGLDTSTLSRAVNNLVNLGLLNRVASPGDRRYVALSLTEQGKRLCETIDAMNDAYFSRVFSYIPEEKHGQIMESFALFAEALERCDRALGCCGGNAGAGKEF